MNSATRWGVAIAMFLSTVLGHAALQSLWTQPIVSTGGITHTAEVTKIDGAGDFIIAGSISETATGTDLWVVKLDGATGGVKWTFRKNGVLNGNDKLGGVVIGPDNDVYVAAALVNQPISAGVNGFDAYLARLDHGSGVPVWETPPGPGAPGDDAWHGIALDAAGNPVVTGVLAPVGGNFGGDCRTAKYSAASGALIWEQSYRAFETQMLDQGERVFVDAGGVVFVQGSHLPGFVTGTNYDQTVLMLSYKEDGSPRFAVRYREGQSARAYGLAPDNAGGFIVGLSVIVPPGNLPTLTISRGNPDGTPATEAGLPLVTNVPTFRAAANGDILFTGRGVNSQGQGPSIVAGRLAPGDLSAHWARELQPATAGPGVGFAHVDYIEEGSAVAGIGPGSASQDLIVTTILKNGVTNEQLRLDADTQGGVPVQDQLAGGSTMDSNAAGTIAVVNTAMNAAGERVTMIRRLRLFRPPSVAFTNPDPLAPDVTAFSQITLKANATDEDNDTVRVEFFVDGSSVGTVPLPPFEAPYTFSTTGTHTIEAVASDTSGATSTTGPITLVAHVPTPVVTTGGASRTGATTGQFDGTVSNLPLGGTARFRFQLSGSAPGNGVSTAIVPVGASIGSQPVSIPFTFPLPHRSYDYFLEVTTTDGTETVVQGSTPQSFLIPNAPVLAQSDFTFFPRGKIVGTVLGNDSDDDANELLTVTFLNPALPGIFTAINGAFVFTPNRDFTGESVFSYTVNDGHGSVVTETLRIRNGRHYAGIYHALPPLGGEHLGVVNAVVTPGGRATVSIYLDGRRYSGSGLLKQQPGEKVGFTLPVRRKGEVDKELVLAWDVNRQFTAVLSQNDTMLYSATGVRAGISPLVDVRNFALVGTHTNVSGNASGRVQAHASLKVELDGRVRFRGKLGDGTPFVTVARAREDGRIPVYTPLRGRSTSFLAGFLEVNTTNAQSEAPGMVAVQGAGTAKTPLYSKSYRDVVDFAGPLFLPATPLTPPLTFANQPRMITVSTIGGGLDGLSFSLPVWMSQNGSVGGIIGITRISVNGQTGEFEGAFLPAGQFRTLPFSGILRPGQNRGIGIFRGTTAAGVIDLVPQ